MTDQQEREDFKEWYESTDFFKSKRLRLDDKETRRAVFRNVWEQARATIPQGMRMPEGLHPETAKHLVLFFNAMAEKLRAAEQKYGYSDGWLTQEWQDELRIHMHEHIAKGDPRDVANYCMFLWARKWPTEISPKEEANERYRKFLAERVDALVAELIEIRAANKAMLAAAPQQPTD